MVETVPDNEDNLNFATVPTIGKDTLTESELRQIEDNPIVDNYNLILQERLNYISNDLQLPFSEYGAGSDDIKHLLQDIQNAKLSVLKYKISCATGFDGYEINNEDDLTYLKPGSISLLTDVHNGISDNAYIMINNRY